MPRTSDLVCPKCGRALERGRARCPFDGASPVRRERPATGKVLARRYRLDDVLGTGGWATVYRARDLRTKTDVALKLLSPSRNADPRSLSRFLGEARTLSRLNHPHVVTVHDCGRSGRSVFIVMELLAGRALSEEIVREAPFPPARAIRIALQICDGLAAAHDRGVIHRDLKPGNVLLCDRRAHESYAKVADFGIARSLVEDDDDPRSQPGTPAYTSPEQASGDGADARSDLYALGLILFEMLSGEPAFPHETALSTLQRRLMQPAPEIHLRFPELALPPGLGEASATLLARRPEDRPPDARAARRLLEPFSDAAAPSRAAESAADPDLPLRITPLQFSPSVLGRRTELEAIVPLVQRLGEYPYATLLVLHGPIGLGKTVLAEKVLEIAGAQRGARTHSRECIGDGLPLREVAQVIEDLLGTRDLDAGALQSRLAALDPVGAADLAGLLRPLPRDDRAFERDPEAFRNYQFQMALDTLARLAAERPLVLLLDGAHGADPLTQGLLGRLGLWSHDRGRGLLLVATWSTGLAGAPLPEEITRSAERFGERVRIVAIDPMPDHEIDALLRAVGPIDGEARSFVAREAAGSPLHAIQVVRHLRSEKLLLPTRRGWRLAPRARFEISVPPLAQDLGIYHLRQLRRREQPGPLAADLVERAALCGDRVPLPLLRDVLLRVNRHDLLDPLAELHDLLIHEDLCKRDPDGDLVFSRPFVRGGIAARFEEAPEAAALHGAIAETLLALHAEAPETARAIAIHLLRAGAPARALPLALRSARYRRSLSDLGRACEDYLLALRILDVMKRRNTRVRLEIHLGLGDVYLLQGENTLAEEQFMHALEIKETPDALLGLGKVAEAKGNYTIGVKRLTRAEKLFRAAGRLSEIAEANAPAESNAHAWVVHDTWVISANPIKHLANPALQATFQMDAPPNAWKPYLQFFSHQIRLPMPDHGAALPVPLASPTTLAEGTTDWLPTRYSNGLDNIGVPPSGIASFLSLLY